MRWKFFLRIKQFYLKFDIKLIFIDSLELN